MVPGNVQRDAREGFRQRSKEIFLRSLNLSQEAERPQDPSLSEADGMSDVCKGAALPGHGRPTSWVPIPKVADERWLPELTFRLWYRLFFQARP